MNDAELRYLWRRLEAVRNSSQKHDRNSLENLYYNGQISAYVDALSFFDDRVDFGTLSTQLEDPDFDLSYYTGRFN